MSNLRTDRRGGLFVIGEMGGIYTLSPSDPTSESVIAVIDTHLATLRDLSGPVHPDIDILLDARLELETRAH